MENFFLISNLIKETNKKVNQKKEKKQQENVIKKVFPQFSSFLEKSFSCWLENISILIKKVCSLNKEL